LFLVLCSFLILPEHAIDERAPPAKSVHAFHLLFPGQKCLGQLEPFAVDLLRAPLHQTLVEFGPFAEDTELALLV